MRDSYRLDGGDQSLLISLRAGRPHLDYWGPSLPPNAVVEAPLRERATPHGMLDLGEAFDLFPQAGHGFTGRPAIEFFRAEGGGVSQMQCWQVSEGDGDLLIIMSDPHAALEAELHIQVDQVTGVAGFRTRVINRGACPLSLNWVASIALPFAHAEVMAFGGRWAREFDGSRFALGNGLWESESRTGRTSHHAPPFVIIGEPGFGETHGEVLAAHLAWSGDHRLFVERLRDGRLQAQAGELFWPGEMALAPGDSYGSPWLYAARSHTGLNGISDRLHPFVRDKILNARLRGKPRQVHFNTWEAVYFRHEMSELKALASSAASVGAERFVLDDGWFLGRNDDTTSLGDWTADPIKYPQGLGPLAAHVQSLGMTFGLWVEPEMANVQSQCLSAHPDWVLGDPDRQQPLGRGQYVLDLTRTEVADAVFQQLDRLLSETPIAYLKWDMNRDLTHPLSGGRMASHDQTCAVYALIDKLRAKFPDVEIESCASGGGRADYEILKRTDRIWISDTNDPYERQSIQQAAALFFPPEVLGAHVGPRSSHTTGRVTSLELRALTALFGHMGIEADIRAFRPEDLKDLAKVIDLYKTHRALIHSGRRLRLSPPDPGAIAFVYVGSDDVLVSLAQLETPKTATLSPLRVLGLDPNSAYDVTLLNPPAAPRATMKIGPSVVLGETVRSFGLFLGQEGLPLPVLRAGDLAVFHIKRAAGPGLPH